VHIACVRFVAHSTLLARLLVVPCPGALLLPGVGKKARKPRKKKDPNAPKKALSGFMFFSNANRERIKTENPGIPFGQVRCGYEIDIGSIDSFEWLPCLVRPLCVVFAFNIHALLEVSPFAPCIVAILGSYTL
jgi:hypothetical protein